MRQNYKTKTLAIGLCFAGYQKSFGFLLGWLHSESFAPKAYLPQTKFPPIKVLFCTKTLILALFGPFQALLGPFLTLFNEKTPFIALVGEIPPPHFLSLCPLPPSLASRPAQLMVPWCFVTHKIIRQPIFPQLCIVYRVLRL